MPTTPPRRKTIYLFGAGASAAEAPGAPTSAELLPRGLGRRPTHYPALEKFLLDWGFKGRHLPTVEELLALLDTCLGRGEPLGQRWSISDLTRCREELVACIYDFIGEAVCPAAAEGADHGLYRRLSATLPDGDLVVMTLNYDLLLDQGLRDDGRAPVFGMDFLRDAPGEPIEPARPDADEPGRPIKLFKLHGSLDWLYCPACSSTLRIPPGRVGEPYDCPTCAGRMNALIVPPTPVKVAPSPFLSGLWKKAEWELAQAREVVFIGYSLGEADANIRYMLFRAFFGHAPKVVVVLKSHDAAADATIAGRYQRLFPGGVTFRWGGFEAFVAEREGGGAGPG
jgi:hypothetical protein